MSYGINQSQASLGNVTHQGGSNCTASLKAKGKPILGRLALGNSPSPPQEGPAASQEGSHKDRETEDLSRALDLHPWAKTLRYLKPRGLWKRQAEEVAER